MLGEMIHFDWYFCGMGWNHKLGDDVWWIIVFFEFDIQMKFEDETIS